MAKYTEYADRTDWLNGRKKTLGASETASAIGLGFMTPSELWRNKMGRGSGEDELAHNDRVIYGSAAEAHLRALFELQYKDKYEVEYHPYRVYESEEAPFMSCTLDGELTEKETQRLGVWECKTAWCLSRRDFDEWERRIPQKYYVQVLSQLFVTKRDFAVLTAQLIKTDGNSEIRHYTIEREEVVADMEYVVAEAKRFWHYIEEGKEPPLKITL